MGTHLTLIHPRNQLIDLVLAVPNIASLYEVLELPCPEPSRRVAQLERPQKVARLLEVGPYSKDLMDQILHTDDTKLAKIIFDDLIVGEGNALLVDFTIAALVDELAGGLEIWVAVGDPGLHDFEHLVGGFGETNENTIVNL